jgi:hypothetical protein
MMNKVSPIRAVLYLAIVASVLFGTYIIFQIPPTEEPPFEPLFPTVEKVKSLPILQEVKSLPTLQEVKSLPTLQEVKSLMFLHIPKCGGRSVRDDLVEGVKQKWTQLEKLEKAADITQKKDYWFNTWQGADPKTPFLPRDFPSNSSILGRHQAARYRIRFLSGHIAHGACQFLAPPCNYVTVLRNPRHRLFSEVKWIQLALKDRHPEMINLTISQFIEGAIEPNSPSGRFCKLLDNHETRLLSGDSFSDQFYSKSSTPCRQLQEHHSRQAVVNMQNMLAVGFLENLSGFFRTLSHKLGIKFPYSGQAKNVNPNSDPLKVQLTPKVEALVEEFTKHDWILYQAAEEYWPLEG